MVIETNVLDKRMLSGIFATFLFVTRLMVFKCPWKAISVILLKISSEIAISMFSDFFPFFACQIPNNPKISDKLTRKMLFKNM